MAPQLKTNALSSFAEFYQSANFGSYTKPLGHFSSPAIARFARNLLGDRETHVGGVLQAMLGFPFKTVRRKSRRVRCTLARTYQTISSASVDQLWQTVANLADVSWHPLLASTNVPRGLIVKPGLIYQAVTRLIPFPIRVFVERVRPGELLSVRVLVIPGLEERATYQVESTVCGTRVSYSITLKGPLSPLIWSLIHPYAASVASKLAQAAEQAALQAMNSDGKSLQGRCFDF